MKALFLRKIAFMIAIALCISGCSKSQTSSGSSSNADNNDWQQEDNKDSQKDDEDNWGEDDEDNWGEDDEDNQGEDDEDNWGEDDEDNWGEDDEVNKIQLNGYVDTGVFALEKSTLESMNFSGGDDHLWMNLENYSEQPIIITGAYIKVINYKPLEYDGYVIYYMGDGDTFDQILGLNAEVDSAPGLYPAVQVDVDEYGYIDFDSLYENGGDSVPHIEINSSNGKNIICRVVFSDPGIYTYQLCIQYLYNNKEQEVESEEIITLYDNDSDSTDRAEEEFFENEEYYMQYT